MTHTQQPQRTERRLTRRSGDRIFAGVASGIADHIDINVWFVRLAFFVLAFAGGFGVLAYITAWLVIPKEDEDDPLVTQWIERFDTSDAGTLFGVLLLAVAGIIVVAQIADVSTVLVIAAVLFVVGYLLYRGDLSSTASTSPPEAPREPLDAATDADADVDADADEATVETAAASIAEAKAPKESRAPKPKRERSMLGRITIAAALIVVATMALVDMAFSRVQILPVHYVATAAGVLGVGLVVGAFIGRARWLAIIGFILLPILWVAALAPSSWSLGAGERSYAPTSVSEIRDDYGLGAGQLTLDLTGMSPAELAEAGSVSVSIGAGEIVVYINNDIGTLLDLEVGAGEITGPFRTESGFGVDVRDEIGPLPTRFRLNVEAGLGVISIVTVTEVTEVTP